VKARWLALLLSATASCGSSREAAEQHSAAQVARAIEVVREAPNAAKAPALESLRKLDCRGTEVCAARDVCAAAYREHVEAVALTEAAKLKLVEGQGAEAAKLLGSAQQKLGAAKDQVAGCTDREAALRRRYKL
jgi:hypothetical protein